jgi:hypothetical protein
MNEQTIEVSRYYDLQIAYQDCHEKLLAAERKADRLKSDNIRFSRREVELEEQLSDARSLIGKASKEQEDEIKNLRDIVRTLLEDVNGYLSNLAHISKVNAELRWKLNVSDVHEEILRINIEGKRKQIIELQERNKHVSSMYNSILNLKKVDRKRPSPFGSLRFPSVPFGTLRNT